MPYYNWRERARPITQKVSAQYSEDATLLKKKLRAVYPFGEQEYHSNKIWLDKIKLQSHQKIFE